MDYAKEFKNFAIKDQGINSLHLEPLLQSMYPVGMTPNIIEERQLNAIAMDVFSRLMMDRIIFLGTPVSDQVANIIQAQLLFLASTDSSKDIQIYINSPGGSVTAGLAIYDTMQFIRPHVTTMCIGQAASMGALLLCAGTKGKRSALPHSRIMIHQPLGGFQGQAAITGKSALIVDGGRVDLATELYEEATITGTVRFRESGRTMTGLLGDWVVAISIVGLVGCLAVPRLRNPRINRRAT